jgi:essential nuclear protein 1
VLLPLCEPGACTLHLAAIVASVVTRVSVPVLHASAALLKMCEMEYSGPVSVFMRTILDKAYALPYRVVDAVAQHFARFTSDSRVMPVLWHQCLLVFVQRYRGDLTEEQREGIRDVMRVKFHQEITPEIRRELFARGGQQAAARMEFE